VLDDQTTGVRNRDQGIQNTQTGFAYNGESDLDLEYTMNIINPLSDVQKVTLYQVRYLVQLAVTTYSCYLFCV